jgi:hypothetical protein
MKRAESAMAISKRVDRENAESARFESAESYLSSLRLQPMMRHNSADSFTLTRFGCFKPRQVMALNLCFVFGFQRRCGYYSYHLIGQR